MGAVMCRQALRRELEAYAETKGATEPLGMERPRPAGWRS